MPSKCLGKERPFNGDTQVVRKVQELMDVVARTHQSAASLPYHLASSHEPCNTNASEDRPALRSVLHASCRHAFAVEPRQQLAFTSHRALQTPLSRACCALHALG